MTWTVTCSDGVDRAARTFSSRGEAAHWATWGHVCYLTHRFRRGLHEASLSEPQLPEAPAKSSGLPDSTVAANASDNRPVLDEVGSVKPDPSPPVPPVPAGGAAGTVEPASPTVAPVPAPFDPALAASVYEVLGKVRASRG